MSLDTYVVCDIILSMCEDEVLNHYTCIKLYQTCHMYYDNHFLIKKALKINSNIEKWSECFYLNEYFKKEYGKLYTTIFDSNLDRFYSIPLFNLSNKQYGDYIDFIGHDHMTQPIMRGLDRYNRCFLLVRYSSSKKESDITSMWSPDDNPTCSVMCIFQRYPGMGSYVVGSRYYYTLHCEGGLRKNSLHWIKQLVNGEVVDNPMNIRNVDRIGDTLGKKNIDWSLC